MTAWTNFCRRTDDPKLGAIERQLDQLGIAHRRNGFSAHGPILQVPEADHDLAYSRILLAPDPAYGTFDDVPDDDPRFAAYDGPCQACLDALRGTALFQAETFTLVMHDPEQTLTWDVDKARALVRATPRTPRVLPPPGEPRPFLFQGGEVNPQHLAHIPKAIRDEPGLAVVLDNDGTPLVVQIDGSHRAALAREAGRPTRLYMLTEDEQIACVRLYTRDGLPQPLPWLEGPAPTV